MATNKKQVRKNFRDSVFKRDGYKCVECGAIYSKETAEKFLDAHHITDRTLMPSGGYVKENGISLCKDDCHVNAEVYHGSCGQEWFPGMHPDDLYKLIGSSLELAMRENNKL